MSEYQRLVLRTLRFIIRLLYSNLSDQNQARFGIEFDEALRELKQ